MVRERLPSTTGFSGDSGSTGKRSENLRVYGVPEVIGEISRAGQNKISQPASRHVIGPYQRGALIGVFQLEGDTQIGGRQSRLV